MQCFFAFIEVVANHCSVIKKYFWMFFFFQLPRRGDRYQIVAAVIVDPTSLLKTMRVCLVTVQSDTAVALLLH